MKTESRLVAARMTRNWRREEEMRDFPGGPVVKTLYFHCRGHCFNPWLGN